MRNFKGIIMSENTSKLTIFSKFSPEYIHCMPYKPIASAGCDASIIFM